MPKKTKNNSNNNGDKKYTRTIQVNTPYISVTVTSDTIEDTLEDIKNKAENILDKYKHHHLINDKGEDYV